MTRYRSAKSGVCPSWAKLARLAAEGGPWPVEHLRGCQRCSERRALLVEMYALVAESADAVSPVTPCPDPREVIALVEGEIGSHRRLCLAEHLAECESCAALMRELAAFASTDEPDWEVREGSASATEEEMAPSAIRRPRLRMTLGRVAAVLVLVAALIALYSVPFPRVDSGSESRWRGPAAVLQAQLQWPPGGGGELHWTATPQATSYRVRVWRGSGEKVLERHLAASGAPELFLTLEGVSPGDTLLFQVDVLDTGVVIATTGPEQFRWRAP